MAKFCAGDECVPDNQFGTWGRSGQPAGMHLPFERGSLKSIGERHAKDRRKVGRLMETYETQVSGLGMLYTDHRCGKDRRAWRSGSR